MSIVTSSSSYLNRKTPGVYVTEIDAFGTGIVGVATAVPIFVGYTEFAGDPSTGKPLYLTPVPITSMVEYVQYFGGAASANFSVSVMGNPNPPTSSSSSSSAIAVAQTPSFIASYTPTAGQPAVPTPFLLQSAAIPGEPSQFNLYWSMMAFFANGGSQCYVVSVGSYWTNESPTSAPDPTTTAGWLTESISSDALNLGLAAAGYAIGPTMTVVPEACQLATYDGSTWTYNGYDDVIQTMLTQASVLQDRVAIIDLPGCQSANTYNDLVDCQTGLADAMAAAVSAASYGASYAPAVVASVVTANNILFTNLVDPSGANSVINNILTTQAYILYPPATQAAALATVQAAIAAAFPITGSPTTNTAQFSNDSSAYPTMTTTNQTLAQWQLGLDNMLICGLPVFKQIETMIAGSMNILPPSGFLAGVWSASDSRNGVWNAPANIALASAIEPLYNMSDAEQGGFNVPTNGEAINIIRAQPSRGNVVWGARTLDGNSLDYRYIQVRRTLIYVEQSIKLALQPYVFAANDSLTWSTVIAAVSSFLTSLWQGGGLMGAKPSDAFTVSCGLGTTMTSQNVLDGYMIVAVTLQMIHPAEFIELTFTQTMGS
jgi:phage tail sheath protein FI